MIESQSVLTSFWCRACFLMLYFSESFLSKIPENASESFLSEVFLPKLFSPKIFDFKALEHTRCAKKARQLAANTSTPSLPLLSGLLYFLFRHSDDASFQSFPFIMGLNSPLITLQAVLKQRQQILQKSLHRRA